MEKTNKLINWIKGEIVLVTALLLALVSSFFVRPGKQYISYIDFRVLVLLLCLMLVVAGLKELGIFQIMGEKMCLHASNTRSLALTFIMLCFVSSMLITNDVALITFVPFSMYVFSLIDANDLLVRLIVLETIAANLGSMLTPIGNPQNLLLFSKGNMSVGAFLMHMLPLTLLSLIIIILLTISMQNRSLNNFCVESNTTVSNKKMLVAYFVLFLICLGNVFHLYSHWIVAAIVIVSIFFIDKTLFTKADYSLLFTFIGFFIFIGNMKQIDVIQDWLSHIIMGNELLIGVLASQIISNVPAAMLLSGFTTDYKSLLYGVNLGGLGTLIASMASLISYRFFVKANPDDKKKYFFTFTVYNFGLLIVLYMLVKVASFYFCRT